MLRRALVVLLVCCGLAAVAVAPAAAAPPRLVVAMAFNMHHAVGIDQRLDLRRIASVIRGSGADVVGLQEVDRHYSERSGWVDQAGELGRMLGYHVAFGANIDLPPPAEGRPRVQYGTAILSRHPIIRAHNTLLPVTPGEEPRGLLHAELDVYGTRAHAYSTHLGDRIAADRQRQADRVAALVRQDEPAVLLGDLNATPEAPEIRTIAARLADAWVRTGLGSGDTYPAEAPAKRIDYLFTNAAARPLLSRVLRTPASDHLPLLTPLLLGGR